MRRVGDRQFLLTWQVLRAASQPNAEATSWRIGVVLCRRYRHSLITPDHSIVADVCHVGEAARPDGWHLIVTSENWWDSCGNVVRSQQWAVQAAGSRDAVMDWIAQEASNLDYGASAQPT